MDIAGNKSPALTGQARFANRVNTAKIVVYRPGYMECDVISNVRASHLIILLFDRPAAFLLVQAREHVNVGKLDYPTFGHIRHHLSVKHGMDTTVVKE